MDLPRLQAAEEELLTSAARHDARRLRELLHPEFIEIGRSGQRWTRAEIISALADEGDRVDTVTDEWQLIELDENLALLTYVIRGADRWSRHSSVWETADGRLRLRFHQGTFLADE